MSYIPDPNHHPNSKRSQNLQRAYGLTWTEYKRMFEAQAGRCGICRRTLTNNVLNDEEKLTLHVDHNHKSGEVRGLLCSNCNTGLGLFKDDPRRLKRAIRYLMHGSKALVTPKEVKQKARRRQLDFDNNRKLSKLVVAQKADENDSRVLFDHAVNK